MSMRHMLYTVELTPDANPYTLCQIVAPSTHGVVLRAVELMPLGSTAATPPLAFDLIEQNSADGLTADTSAVVLEKWSPVTGSVALTINKKSTGSEPGTVSGGQRYPFTLHQQASRIWTPPNASKVIVIPPSGRLGLRNISATFAAIRATLYLEE